MALDSSVTANFGIAKLVRGRRKPGLERVLSKKKREAIRKKEDAKPGSKIKQEIKMENPDNPTISPRRRNNLEKRYVEEINPRHRRNLLRTPMKEGYRAGEKKDTNRGKKRGQQASWEGARSHSAGPRNRRKP